MENLVFLLTSIIQVSKNIQNNFQLSEGPYHTDTLELFSYIKKSVPDDETIIFYKPRSMSLFTKKKQSIMTKLRILRLDNGTL